MENISEAKIYVGTYAKYNAGSIDGKWFELSDYADKEEFYRACLEYHNDEDDPELMFQDWEFIPAKLIGESWLSDNFFKLRDAVLRLNEDMQRAFSVWCDYTGSDISEVDPDDLISDFEDSFVGEYDSETDFAEELLQDYGGELSEFTRRYFDIETYTKDLFMGDYYYEEGFVFRS